MIRELSEEECERYGIDRADIADLNEKLMQFKQEAKRVDEDSRLRELQEMEWQREIDLWDLQQARFEELEIR